MTTDEHRSTTEEEWEHHRYAVREPRPAGAAVTSSLGGGVGSHGPGRLRVVDHAPAAWFLLTEGDALLLDVSCNHGAFGYSVLVELSGDERAALDREGRSYLDGLARAIHDSAPAARGSTSPYRARDLTRVRRGDVTDAVRRWRGQTPTGG